MVLFYTAAGFLILPLIIRAVAVKQLSKQLDREVSIAKVKLNRSLRTSALERSPFRNMAPQHFQVMAQPIKR